MAFSLISNLGYNTLLPPIYKIRKVFTIVIILNLPILHVRGIPISFKQVSANSSRLISTNLFRPKRCCVSDFLFAFISLIYLLFLWKMWNLFPFSSRLLYSRPCSFCHTWNSCNTSSSEENLSNLSLGKAKERHEKETRTRKRRNNLVIFKLITRINQ